MPYTAVLPQSLSSLNFKFIVMKILIYRIATILILFFIYKSSFAQFPEPTGDDGPINMGSKTIKEGDHYCQPWATGHKKKKRNSTQIKI